MSSDMRQEKDSVLLLTESLRSNRRFFEAAAPIITGGLGVSALPAGNADLRK